MGRLADINWENLGWVVECLKIICHLFYNYTGFQCILLAIAQLRRYVCAEYLRLAMVENVVIILVAEVLRL